MMSLVVAGRPWFSWAAPLFVFSGVGLIVSLFIGYYVKVSSNKNPRE